MWLSGYDAGAATERELSYVRGWRACRAALVTEFEVAVATEVELRWAVLHGLASDVARSMAAREPYDVLADRRGQSARAEAHRRLLAARGVAA